MRLGNMRLNTHTGFGITSQVCRQIGYARVFPLHGISAEISKPIADPAYSHGWPSSKLPAPFAYLAYRSINARG